MMSATSLSVGDMDIAQLTDEELFQQLTALGAVAGPIVCKLPRKLVFKSK